MYSILDNKTGFVKQMGSNNVMFSLLLFLDKGFNF